MSVQPDLPHTVSGWIVGFADGQMRHDLDGRLDRIEDSYRRLEDSQSTAVGR